MKSTTFALLMFLVLLAAGCGQTGPLYVPGDPSTIQPPQKPADADDQDDDDREESDRR